jgi:hypothetical protein
MPEIGAIIQLCESNEGSPEPIDVSKVLDCLFEPKDILRALIYKVTREVKHNERVLHELELVTRVVNTLDQQHSTAVDIIN